MSRKQCKYHICSLALADQLPLLSSAYLVIYLMLPIVTTDRCHVDSVNWKNLSIGRLSSENYMCRHKL